MRRIVTVSLALVVGAFLIAQFAGDDKRDHGAVETSGVEPLPTPLTDPIIEPLAGSPVGVVEEYEDSPQLEIEDVADSSEPFTENEEIADSVLARSRVLNNMFFGNGRVFSQQLAAHHLASYTDDEWSPRATASLTEWFGNGDDGDIVVDCAADICLIDFFVPDRDFMRNYRIKARQWGKSEPEGFMRASYFFRNQDGSTRLYFFRDSFDPESL